MAKGRKPAIDGLARPQGILDDFAKPLGKAATSRLRRAVRGAIKAENSKANTKDYKKYLGRMDREFNKRAMARQEFIAMDNRIRRMGSKHPQVNTSKNMYKTARADEVGGRYNLDDKGTIPRMMNKKFESIMNSERNAMRNRARDRAVKRAKRK